MSSITFNKFFGNGFLKAVIYCLFSFSNSRMLCSTSKNIIQLNLSPPQNRLYFCLVSLSFICNIYLIPITWPYYQLRGISDLCISTIIFFQYVPNSGNKLHSQCKRIFHFLHFLYTKYTYFWLFKEFKAFFQLN